MFIGRKDEIKEIIDRIKGRNKEFIAIAGKRGIGKTWLMLEVKKRLEQENNGEFIQLIISGKKKVPTKKQLQEVAQEIKIQLGEEVVLNSWKDFFVFIKQKTSNPNIKFVLYIDEFPWFNTKGSYFVDDFGSFWNIDAENNLKIILTGSAVSWLNKNVFRTKGGLYHKTTRKFLLKSFDLKETKEFLLKSINPNINNHQVVEYYLLTGGVVRYLQKIKPQWSIKENALSLYNESYFDDFF